MLATLVITITRQWAPVLDFHVIPAAVGGGIMIGGLGGLLAVTAATRIRPARALRQ